MATLTTVLLVSLFGSLHCAGMCGPLVAFAVGATESQTWRARIGLPLAYHGGRLATYALIGAMGGLLGTVVDFGGSLIGLDRLGRGPGDGVLLADIPRGQMSDVYILLPVAVVLAIAAVAAFIWAVRHGQFDDLETPAVRMLHDDDDP